MNYRTTLPLVKLLLEDKQIVIEEITYLERKITLKELFETIEYIEDWKFHSFANHPGKYYIIGDENPLTNSYVTIVVSMRQCKNYRDDYISLLLFGKKVDYHTMVSELKKENVYIVGAIIHTENHTETKRFDSISQIEINMNGAIDIKPTSYSPFPLCRQDIEYIFNVGSAYPFFSTVENELQIALKNGRTISLRYNKI